MKTKYQLFTFVTLGALLFLVIGILAGGAMNSPVAQAKANLQSGEDTARTVTVVGEGKVSGAPDLALVNLGVQVTNPEVQAATQQASDQMESLLAALKGEGIADKDIQTSYYNLYVDRPYGPQGPTGESQYQVSNTVQVTVREPDRLTEILGVAIEAGANSINSIEFRLSDPAELRSEARASAVASARARAEELAELNDVAIGEVLSVSEVIDSGAYFVSEQSYAAGGLGAGGGGGGPISPGEVNVSVQLQITYAILQ